MTSNPLKSTSRSNGDKEEESQRQIISVKKNDDEDNDDVASSLTTTTTKMNPNFPKINDRNNHYSNIIDNTTSIKSGMKNTELTTNEKLKKKLLKSHLKQQMRLKKYETRYCQALKRNDEIWKERSKQEYEAYYQSLLKNPDSFVHTPSNTYKSNLLDHLLFKEKASSTSSESSYQVRPQHLLKDDDLNNNKTIEEMSTDQYNSKFLLEEIWNPLRSIIFASSNKIEETSHARSLLQNMTKGTQTKTMFQSNNQALLGYTRHKFLERANLALLSLHRYYTSTCTTTRNNDDDDELLLMPPPTQIWSIGCGPGCDAAGIASYYHNYSRQKQQQQQQHVSSSSSSSGTTTTIQRMVLMDFVMDEWNEICVNELIPLLEMRCNIPIIKTSNCDVSHSLLNSTINKSALSTILQQHSQHKYGSSTPRTDDDDNNRQTSNESINIDNGNDTYLVVVSYLLTETRGRWYDFFKDVLMILPSGSLLLLSEPTAWQLHIFLDKFGEDSIHSHMWLDSSMNTPELQKLENRMGPAVIMVRTK